MQFTRNIKLVLYSEYHNNASTYNFPVCFDILHKSVLMSHIHDLKGRIWHMCFALLLLLDWKKKIYIMVSYQNNLLKM